MAWATFSVHGVNGKRLLVVWKEHSRSERKASLLFENVVEPANDKTNSSGGWRYLDAAPSDASPVMQWNDGRYLDVKTDTKIGSVKANIEAMFATQGSGSYAAKRAAN